jgi:hypothetical protein
VRLRLGDREDDDDLIDVRRHDALEGPATRRTTRQLRPARQNLDDRPGVIALSTLDDDVVSNRQLLVLALLEPTAERRRICLSGVRTDLPHAACSSKYDALRAAR